MKIYKILSAAAAAVVLVACGGNKTDEKADTMMAPVDSTPVEVGVDTVYGDDSATEIIIDEPVETEAPKSNAKTSSGSPSKSTTQKVEEKVTETKEKVTHTVDDAKEALKAAKDETKKAVDETKEQVKDAKDKLKSLKK